MGRRIITTENLEEDVKIESHLRPQLLEDYIGQAKAKETLKIYIEAAKSRGEHWIMCCFTVRLDLERQPSPGSLRMKWA